MMIWAQIFASYFYSDVKISHNLMIGLKKCQKKEGQSQRKKENWKFGLHENQLLVAIISYCYVPPSDKQVAILN